MTDEDLVQWLRERGHDAFDPDYADRMYEAADRIDELEAEVERQAAARAVADDRLGRVRGWLKVEHDAAVASVAHVESLPAGSMSVDFGRGREVALADVLRQVDALLARGIPAETLRAQVNVELNEENRRLRARIEELEARPDGQTGRRLAAKLGRTGGGGDLDVATGRPFAEDVEPARRCGACGTMCIICTPVISTVLPEYEDD